MRRMFTVNAGVCRLSAAEIQTFINAVNSQQNPYKDPNCVSLCGGA